MRKRHQKGSLSKIKGSWVVQWWEDGHRRKRTLGRASQMTKAQAQNELDAILAPINRNQQDATSSKRKFGEFIDVEFLPFYRRKWKTSTIGTNEDRLRHHLTSQFSEWTLDMFSRDKLQTYLDQKAAANLSFSTVGHLRWDLKQIFGMAVAEGYLTKNPAALLFVPKAVRQSVRTQMTAEQVGLLFSVLDDRELLIAKLAVLSGMRPGEIFALMWKHLREDHIVVEQRLYRGKIDSPKTTRSVRKVAFSEGLQNLITKWKNASVDSNPSAWVFPSEKLTTPLAKDNCWRRHFAPKLAAAGLGWVNFQVMRRTHSSIMRDNDVDPKVVADQLGHSLDVNLNVYTQTALSLRAQAVNTLESIVEKARKPAALLRIM